MHTSICISPIFSTQIETLFWRVAILTASSVSERWTFHFEAPSVDAHCTQRDMLTFNYSENALVSYRYMYV